MGERREDRVQAEEKNELDEDGEVDLREPGRNFNHNQKKTKTTEELSCSFFSSSSSSRSSSVKRQAAEGAITPGRLGFADCRPLLRALDETERKHNNHGRRSSGRRRRRRDQLANRRPKLHPQVKDLRPHVDRESRINKQNRIFFSFG